MQTVSKVVLTSEQRAKNTHSFDLAGEEWARPDSLWNGARRNRAHG
jgi:hypothetical protein